MGKIVKKKDHGGSRYKKEDVSNILHNWAKDIQIKQFQGLVVKIR